MKQLILLGSGPGHLQVLIELAQAPLPGTEITLVTASPREVLAGMLPGWVAGRYTLDDCVLPLAPLLQAARVQWIEGVASALEPAERRLQLADGREIGYDALSLDVEPAMARDGIAGAREHALFLRPVEPFVRLWEAMRELAAQRTLNVVVVGSGLPAVEFALAVQHRLASRVRVALVTGDSALLPAHAAALRERVKRCLRRHKITLFEDACTAITAQQVQLAQGARLACDAPVLALEDAQPAWLAASGLPLDAQGRLLRRPTLQSVPHAELFGAGGSLALNLRRFLAGGELVADRPAALTWQLVADGAQSGLAGWGPLVLEGRWVGDWIERRHRALRRSLQAAS